MKARDMAKFKAQGSLGVQKWGLVVQQDFDVSFIANEARDKVKYRFPDRLETSSV